MRLKVYLATYVGRGSWFKKTKTSYLVIGRLCYSSSILCGSGAEIINLDTEEWELTLVPWAIDEEVLSYFSISEGSRMKSQDWCAAAIGLESVRGADARTLQYIVEDVIEIMENK